MLLLSNVNYLLKSKPECSTAQAQLLSGVLQGKHELDANMLKDVKIVDESIDQASHSAEINVQLSESVIEVKNIYGTTGEVVAGIKKGHANEKSFSIRLDWLFRM